MFAIVEAYVEAGNIDQALAVANRISNPRVQSSVLTYTAIAYIQAGNIEQANRLLRQALTVANRMADSYVQPSALSDIASAYAKAGNIERSFGSS